MSHVCLNATSGKASILVVCVLINAAYKLATCDMQHLVACHMLQGGLTQTFRLGLWLYS